IKGIVAPLNTAQFKDQYQEALRELMEAKIQGKAPAISYEAEPTQTFNFMEALQQSLKAVQTGEKTTRKKPMAKSVAAPSAAAAKKKRKKA
ncbi:MAG: hypothetical protein L0Y42_09440, partial [Phycisphaerales bacterium]|nr:hypothetical protein [Phycisphaerales bacterium]